MNITHTFGINCESAGIKFDIEVEATARLLTAGEDGEGGHAEIGDVTYTTRMGVSSRVPWGMIDMDVIASWERTIFENWRDREDFYEDRAMERAEELQSAFSVNGGST